MQHVPVLDDPAVSVEAEDVDAGVLLIWPDLMTVEHDLVAVGETAFELDPLARVLGTHTLEVVDEGFLAVSDVRIVLSILRARVAFDRLSRLVLIEHQRVERNHVRLVRSRV